MRVLIMEDEARIAKRIERMTRDFFGHEVSVIWCESLAEGLRYLHANRIDVLLLDLNLNGADGFGVLETVVAGPFHTIIISAYTDKAITAFGYGVLDFVPKPFDEARLTQALRRVTAPATRADAGLKYLAVKKAGTISLLNINDLLYIKGAGIYSELHLRNGKQELHDKSMESLEQLLPPAFVRIHKSFIVLLDEVAQLTVESGGKYSLLLNNGEVLPVGRGRYKDLRGRLV